MSEIMDADAANKLAGLQIDLLSKFKAGHITLDNFEWFLKLTGAERNTLIAEWRTRKPAKKIKKDGPILRRLYSDEVIKVDGCEMVFCEVLGFIDFRTMFGSFCTDLENLCVADGLSKVFCAKYQGLLLSETPVLFLQKKDETKPALPDNLEVLYVHLKPGGHFGENRYFFNSGWSWGFEPRCLVIPKLTALRMSGSM